MFRDRLIVDDSLVAEQAGYSLHARMPWYRALPLSCLVEVTLAVDGQTVPAEAITVETDGVALPLSATAQATDRPWFVVDDLVIRVAGPPLADRSSHDVDLTVGLRLPYLPIKGEPLTMREHLHKTMPAKELQA
jgi:hypothetical protein